jgi:AraC-like DNA-binding protein
MVRIHWVTEGHESQIVGIPEGRFSRVLEGRGAAFSVKFRPGGFCGFTARSLHTFAGRTTPASDVFGDRVSGLAEALIGKDDDEGTRHLCQVLRALSPRRDEAAERACAIVSAVAEDPEMTTVARVSERFSIAPLALQRLFRKKVGKSPKWVILRYRLHEALERIHAHAQKGPSLAALAADLGFTDQAHFSRAFKALIGLSPGQYERRVAERSW